MRSIIGYLECGNAAPILVEAPRRMEYRGYDSPGVATLSETYSRREPGVREFFYIESREWSSRE